MNTRNKVPALSKLTDKQKRFVIAYLETGGANETEAARIAGYSETNPNGCSVEANRLMRNDKILAAIKEEAQKRINGGVLLGASVLVEIASDPLHKDRLKAAQSLLDRGGLMQVSKSEHLHIIEDNRTDQELIGFIVAQAKLNGLDPSKLLGFNPDLEIIEAESQEIEDAPPDEPEYVEPDL